MDNADPLIENFVTQRREALAQAHPGAAVPGKDDPLWGLALSGGGIRSATFATGLVSGLAGKGLLQRFDLLSTVSGGGYIGSALGRLYQRDGLDALAIQEKLGKADRTWFVWWLRATSRYLTPRGASDLLTAAATYARNMLAVHLELGVAGLAMGALLGLLNLFVWQGIFEYFTGNDSQLATLGPWMLPWLSTVWLLMALPVLASVPLAAAYWSIPARRSSHWVLAEVAFALLLVAVGLLLGGLAFGAETMWEAVDNGALRVFCGVVGLVCLLSALGPLVARLARLGGERPAAAAPTPPAAPVAGLKGRMQGALRALGTTVDTGGSAEQRNRLTKWLATCLTLFVVLLALGVVDRAAWFVAFEREQYTWLLPFVIAFGVAAVRTLVTQLPMHDPSAAISGRLLSRLAEFGGLLLFGLLVVFWVAVVYGAGMRNLFEPAPDGNLLFGDAALVLLAFLLLPLLYMLLTCKKADFCNLSSLHMFYRARLTRSYLGAANGRRFAQDGQAAVSPLADATPQAVQQATDRRSVFRVDRDDSVAMSGYAPHAAGGPVHIINATINQTRNPMCGMFNQDRKGQYLSVTSDGYHRIGLEPWARESSFADSQLPTWMAISGAAVAPGIGGQTSTGMALLLFMAGVRLGYWWEMAPATQGFWPGLGAWIAPNKYLLMYGEAFAKFGGRDSRFWYLSDGGHFENTGAYALLRQRARLIVLSDAAADPRYEFGDLENLVRKARIDLQADITFVDPATAGNAAAAGVRRFGTLDQLRDATSDACTALARITYADGTKGWLVFVKPNLFNGLPVDVVNYKRDNPAFPQEPTADQFFSEAQWESYFRLGRELGMQLDPALLQELVDDAAWTHDLKVVAPVPAPPAPGGKQDVPFSARYPRAASLAKSGLSLTALAGVLAAMAQTWTSWTDTRAQRQRAYWAELYAASAMYDRVNAGGTGASQLPDLTAKVATLANTYCRGGVNEIPGGSQAGALYNYVVAQCAVRTQGAVTSELTPACAALRSNDARSCLAGNDRLGQPVYWAVDYPDTDWARGRLLAAKEQPERMHFSEGVRDLVMSLANRLGGTLDYQAMVVVGTAAPPPAAPAPAPVAPPPMPAPPPPPPPPMVVETPVVAAAPLPRPPAATASACKGKLIYMQVYRPEDREQAAKRAQELKNAGALVPGIEDVTATAARDKRTAPRPVSAPTAIYHTVNEGRCAEELQRLWPGTVARPLARGLNPTPGVVELWLPPPKS